MSEFYNWYTEKVKAIHPIENESFDRIAAEHYTRTHETNLERL